MFKKITSDKRFPTLLINLIGIIGIILTATGTIGDAEWVKYQASIQAIINIFLPSVLDTPQDNV